VDIDVDKIMMGFSVSCNKKLISVQLARWLSCWSMRLERRKSQSDRCG